MGRASVSTRWGDKIKEGGRDQGIEGERGRGGYGNSGGTGRNADGSVTTSTDPTSSDESRE